MNFYLVLTKNRKKLDKYIKINKIKNKIIIDIKEELEEENIIDNYIKYKNYFNLIIFTKITHALRKEKDIYYIPNIINNKTSINDLFKLKNILKFPDVEINFNLLMFFDDFTNNLLIKEEIFSKIDSFNNIQIIEDY
jgi:hypothetical protein